MLELKNITKVYKTGDLTQQALNDVSLNFRKSEFASILGPSGSGKTTLLNIIGGLDKYTSGDLVINDVSTKKYKDSNWDSYRNHRIGFVFQSYNLISHQTILNNVMLALTLSGISKKESVKRAKQALKDVGLEDHINKRPNQLSGGQMQRVAIARALVNDPDIILADEPTGALDSETSVQIMKILKEVSKTKLVIMVTHNPELAEEYSNRIIKLHDGKIVSDTNPYKTNKQKESKFEKTSKISMSYFTALGLSFNNLMTKKGRTILAAFAGSIGIIGIALIMSLSTGFQNYIDKLQEDTLSSYPLTITSETADITNMLLSMVSEDSKEKKKGKVVEKQYISTMFSNVSSNDLRSFKNYLETHYSKVEKDISSVKYTYSVDPLIYTMDYKNELTKVNPNTMFSSLYGSTGVSSMFSSYSSIFNQMLDDYDVLDEQYEILAGKWPKEADEMVIVLSEPNHITDLLLYFLGYRDINELYDIITKVMSGESIESIEEPMEFTYEELMNTELKLIQQSDVYKYNSKYKIYEDMSEDKEYMNNLYKKAYSLKIVGVVCPKSGGTSMALSPGIAYTSKLIDYIYDYAKNSEIVKKQLNNKEVDVFSNTRFDSKDKDNKLDFQNLITVDTKMLQSAFNVDIDQNKIASMTSGYMNEISSVITTDITPAKEKFINTLSSLASGIFNNYIDNPIDSIANPFNEEEKWVVMHFNDIESITNNYMNSNEVNSLLNNLESEYVLPSSVYKEMFTPLLSGLLSSYIAGYYAVDSSLTTDPTNMTAMVNSALAETTISTFMSQAVVIGLAESFAPKMTEALMQKTILTKVGELTTELMNSIASAFNVDQDKIAKAFKFNLTEDEVKRIMSAMMSTTSDTGTAASNLLTLGYQDLEEPTMISIYFTGFDEKEEFLEFIDSYNELMVNIGEKSKELRYTDTTGILMSSVKKIVNSVSYVLISFVSISLVVSSIMIGIITYISVLERTKEIGILRAMGASKKNISSIFNAETFITGLLSGLIGIGITFALIPVINYAIHTLTDNYDINAMLAVSSATRLVILSICLTLIGGIIPSKKASKQDPVIALRTE